MSSVNQVGKYQLVAEIARGGMGIVYLAVAKGRAGFSKFLVLKELKPELAEDPAYLEMFFEEARLAARLNHPNISQIYEVDSDNDRHFIVMDYLDGRALSRVLRRHDPEFTLGMSLRVLCEVLQGLEYAHTLADYDGTPIGIVHRDVTPQNVFITFDGQIKLVDFGIAKSNDSKIETRAGTLKGKPAYMSPEQVAGSVDPRADVFAVGAMLFEATAGRRVWSNKPDVEILTNLIKGNIPSLLEVAPATPPELARICSKAMAVLPADRYQSAAEMRAELEAYMSSMGMNVTAREVGQRVASMFETERVQTRTAIETHVAAAKAGELGPSLPRLATSTRMEGTPSSDGSSHSGRIHGTGTGTSSMRTPEATAMPASDLPATATTPQRRPILFLVGGIALGAAALLTWTRLKGPLNGDGAAPPASPGSVATATPAAVAVVAASTTTPAPGSPAASASALPAAGAASEASPDTTGGEPGKRAADKAKPVPATNYRGRSREPAPEPPAIATPAPPPAPAKSDCDPPFYFNGSKKVFKPGCI